MSQRQKILCGISILLSFAALNILWHYFGLKAAYPNTILPIMMVVIALNLAIFRPKKRGDNS